MASLVMGSVGSALLGPLGGMIGGQMGSMIDGALFAHHPPKPNLSDLQVEAATFGLPIPVAYGRNKLAGNLIMSTILIASKHSGKGGLLTPTTYYTYSVTCAVAICAGPITNVWRIYADSKVIWDMNPVTTGPGTSQPGTPLPESGFQGTDWGGYATLYAFGTGKKNQNTQSSVGQVTIYYGGEDQPIDEHCDVMFQQNIDPITLQNYAPGTVPAYRGIAYAVFGPGFQLANYGNRIPNFYFEVNGFMSQGMSYSPLPVLGNANVANPLYDVGTNIFWEYGSGELSTYNALSQQQIGLFDYGHDPMVEALNGGEPIDGGNMDIIDNSVWDPSGALWIVEPIGVFGSNAMLINVDPVLGVLYASLVAPSPTGGAAPVNPNKLIVCGSTDIVVVFSSNAGTFQGYSLTGQGSIYAIPGAPSLLIEGDLSPRNPPYLLPSATAYLWYSETGVGFSPFVSVLSVPNTFETPTSLSWSDTRQILVAVDGNNGVQMLLTTSPFWGTPLTEIWPTPANLSNFAADGGPYQVIYDPIHDVFLYYNNHWAYTVPVVEVDEFFPALVPTATLDIVTAFGGSINANSPFQIQQQPNGTYALLIGGEATDAVVHIINTNDLTEISGTNVFGTNWSVTPAMDKPGNFEPVYYPYGQGGILYAVSTAPSAEDPNAPFATEPGIALYMSAGPSLTVGEIVQDICIRCGLSIEQIDVSQLTQELYGYFISQEASGRTAIEQLEEIFLFDMVESNGKLAGRNRAIQAANPAMTINGDDLGARSSSPLPGASPVPRITERIKSDFEIPAAASLRYRTTEADLIVRDFSMQPAAQYTRRRAATTSGTGNISMNTPMVLDDGNAAQIVENILKLQFTERVTLEASLPIKYLSIEPGDVCPVTWTDPEDNVVTYKWYIRQADIGADNTIKCVGVSTEALAYVGSAFVNPLVLPSQPMTTGGGPSTLQVMELPPLQDSDDDVGVYYGACGTNSVGWFATIYRSIDNGSTYSIIDPSDSIPALIGVARNVLGGGATPGVWDETNTLTVVFRGGGTPEAFTPLQVLNHSGIYCVGNEVVGAANAVENEDGSWTLSMLMRGGVGTDQYIGNHLAGERVVLLATDQSIQDQAFNQDQDGVPTTWVAVSNSSTLVNSRKVPVTLNGVRITPEAAAHAGISRDSSNNATIVWNPRNRINYEWLDGIEQQTDEAVEEYQVQIWTGDFVSLLRTITAWTAVTGTVGDATGVDTLRRSVSYTAADQTSDGLVGAGARWVPNSRFTVSLDGLTTTCTLARASSVLTNYGLTLPSSLKVYFEITCTGLGWDGDVAGVTDGTHFFYLNALDGLSHYGATGFAIDFGTKLMWIRPGPVQEWNGSGTADPVAEVGGTDISSLSGTAYLEFYLEAGGGTAVLNAGGSAFSGVVPTGYSYGWPGPLPPTINAAIYQISSRIGLGFPRKITG